MKIFQPCPLTSKFLSTTNKIRKSHPLLRLSVLVGLMLMAAVALGTSSSAANAFGPLFARIFDSSQARTETKVDSALSSASTEYLSPQDASSTMSVERRGHTATRLSDGRVLIAGGENSSGTLNGTEIYDPATATFSTTGNMSAGRADHTATLLSDGRVLIAGGRNGAGAQATTEIFDPVTGTFASGPQMNVARAGHSATLFADGRVLFTGGDAGGSAEILDATLSNFTAAGSMNAARSMHSAALMLNGHVLIVGGHDTGGNTLLSGEIFDTASGSFSTVAGTLTVARVRAHLRVLFDGKVQIIGGSNDGSMEIYDPSIATFGAYAHVLPEGDTCASLPSQVQSAQTRAALFHNGQTNQTFDRSGHSITELSGQAVVVGGVNTAGTVLGSTPMFSSSSAQISTDKLDYAPGETAHIVGRGFQAGETVRLRIHEDPHTPQERGLDVVADTDGNFVGDYLVQDYDLHMKFLAAARGLTSGLTAQTTFTDDVTVKAVSSPSGVTFTLTKTTYSSPSCNGSGSSTTVLNVNSTTGDSTTAGNSTSVKLQAASTSNQGSAFSNWSSGNAFAVIDAFTICVNGAGTNQTRTFTANYVSNVAPVASAVSISGTTQYGHLLTGNYTYSDANGDLEGTSTFRWLRDGVTTVGTSQTYMTVSADVGHTLTFEVTPAAATGVSTGTAVQSAPVTINKANAICSINGYTGSYDAAEHGATGSCTGVDAGGAATGSTLNLGASFTNVPGGTAHWTFTGGTNYNDQSGDAAIVISKVNAVCSINGFTGPYDAADHGASGACTGVDAGGAATGSSLNLGASFTNVPGGTAHWTFTGGTNYNDQSGDAAIVISKVNAVCSINGFTGPYDAADHGASGACTGVDAGGAATGSSLNLGASFTNVPGGTAHWTFTGGTNYNDQSGDAAIVISKVNAVCSINGFTGPYDAADHGASGACTGVDAGGAATGSSLNLGASFTNVPGGTAHWTFTGGTNYNDQSGDAAIVISKVNAVCSINGFTGPYDAADHGASGACTGVDAGGAATGSSLNLGASFTNVPGGTAHWTFTGGTNYNDQSGDAAIVISKVNAVCSINGFTGPYDAADHGASGACTGVDAGGAATGSSLNLGASFTNVPGGTAHWTFTGGTNYNDQSGDAAIVISKVNAVCSINGFTGPYDAADHGASGACTGVDAGGAATGSSLNLGASFTNVPGGTAHWTFTGGTNYNDQSGDAAVVIDKRTLTATIIGNPTKVYDGNTDAALTTANFSLGNLVGAQSFTVTKATGTYNSKDVLTANTVSTTLAVADFAPGGGTSANNYNLPTSASGPGHITAKALTIKAEDKSMPYGGPVPAYTVTYTTLVSGDTPSSFGGTLAFTVKDMPAMTTTITVNGSTPSGTYAIIPSGLTSTNYTITFTHGLLTINSWWTITGFYQPVDMNTPSLFVWNTIKGGSTVPLKFNIYAGTPGPLTERKNVSDVLFGSVQVADIPCSVTQGIESFVDLVTNTGNTTLRYDTTGAQFIQNWQTPKGANKCYQVRMTAIDGSHIDAFFKTK